MTFCLQHLIKFLLTYLKSYIYEKDFIIINMRIQTTTDKFVSVCKPSAELRCFFRDFVDLTRSKRSFISWNFYEFLYRVCARQFLRKFLRKSVGTNKNLLLSLSDVVCVSRLFHVVSLFSCLSACLLVCLCTLYCAVCACVNVCVCLTALCKCVGKF